METITFNKEEMEKLIDAISAEGESVEFLRHDIEKSGRSYLIACSQNDQEERKRRAEIMRKASRKMIF